MFEKHLSSIEDGGEEGQIFIIKLDQNSFRGIENKSAFKGKTLRTSNITYNIFKQANNLNNFNHIMYGFLAIGEPQDGAIVKHIKRWFFTLIVIS